MPIFGIVGEPPHVPVGLYDLRSQDVVLLILPHGHRLQAAVELKGLRAELQHLRGRGERWRWRIGEERRKKNKEIWRRRDERKIKETRKTRQTEEEGRTEKRKMKVIGETTEERKEC